MLSAGFLPLGTLVLGDQPGTGHAWLQFDGVADIDLDLNYELLLATSLFDTPATDNPSNRRFSEALDAERCFDMDSTLSADVGFGGIIESRGSLTIENVDGDYDYLMSFATDGRAAEVRVGGLGTEYRGWPAAFVGVMGAREFSQYKVSVPLHDYADRLDVPVALSTYAGTGGREGGEDLAGKSRPRAFGRPKNVSGALVDATLLIYQVNDGQTQAIEAYVNALPLDFAGDYPTYADLAAATLAPGEYATCLAEGFARLHSLGNNETPTFNVEGDASGAGFVDTIASIVERIVLTATDLTPGELEADDFAAFEAAHSAKVSFYIGHDERPNVADVTTRLLGFGKFHGFTRGGRLTIGLFDLPSGAPRLRLRATDIDAGGVVPVPLSPAMNPPPWRWTVEWGRNWTVMDGSRVAGAVTAARRAFLAEAVRLAGAEAPIVKHNHPLAPERRIEAFYDSAADAQAEAERLLALWSSRRHLYRIPVPDLRPILLRLGHDCVHVTHDRFGFAAGRLARTVGVRVNGATQKAEVLAYV